MATTEDIAGLLRRVPVFEALGPEDLRRVADVAVPRRFAAQQVIFREGDSSDTCYVVRRGHARAVRENIDGRSITLADIAQLAGSSRESASRFLAVLERAGIVTQGRGRITVHDAEALKRYIF